MLRPTRGHGSQSTFSRRTAAMPRLFLSTLKNRANIFLTISFVFLFFWTYNKIKGEFRE